MPSEEAVYAILFCDSIFVPTSETLEIKKMETNRCRDNCEKLYNSNKSYKLFIGYALSDDGLWRNHSWIVTKNNKIIETTIPRIIYIGYKAK